jgi:hypothetical protein
VDVKNKNMKEVKTITATKSQKINGYLILEGDKLYTLESYHSIGGGCGMYKVEVFNESRQLIATVHSNFEF